LKAPGFKPLKLKRDILVSKINLPFQFTLYRYIPARVRVLAGLYKLSSVVTHSA
jgi:hypothetical protein